ncbi:MAG: M23 family metallopeptidase, partial [Clostridium sp.]|nr:M23 family metallopeptidase [Clostridium sp.]
MSRRQRRGEKPETNISMIILTGIVLVVAVAFTLTYVAYNNRMARNTKMQTTNTQILSSADNEMLNMITNETDSKSVSSPVGKSVNEMENTEKIAINTSNYENKTKEEKPVENKQEETKQEEVKDLSFVKPADGEIVKDYSKDNLVYSSTLEEWTTHLGIDIAMQKTDVVKAVADGKVKSIKNDPRYGLTVVIEHQNGFESIYSSLLTAEFITVGEEIKQGSTIATVGNTATFEIADTTHLHFEMKKDGQTVDP